jgi:hypothetical protein
MAPSIKDEVARWTVAGYSQTDARAYVAYQRLGVKPANVTLTEAPEAKAVSSTLYADETKSACNQIRLLSAPADQIALARQMGFATQAAAAAQDPDPAAALGRLLQCGH